MPNDPSRLSAPSFWAAFATLLAIASVPVLRTEMPPLLDYPNHFARMYLLTNDGTDEWLRRYYEIHWQAIPNLALDLIVPLLAKVMPIAWAMKAFAIAVFVFIAGGAALIHRAHTGHWSVWPLFAFLFLYSRFFLLGFLGYLFGVGLALLAFAGWIGSARWPIAQRLALSAAFALVLYFAHLMAEAAYGAMVAGYEIGVTLDGRPLRWRPFLWRLTRAAIPFVPTVVLLLVASHSDLGAPMQYGGIVDRLYHAVAAFDNYNETFDFVGLALLGLLAAFCFVTRRFTIELPLLVPLLLLCLAFLLLPNAAMTGWTVAQRLMVIIYVLLTASVVASATLRPGATRLIAAAGLALFVVRMAVVTYEWDRADAYYAHRLAVLDLIPEHARLAIAYPLDLFVWTDEFLPVAHLPLLAIPRRDAFVPTLFAQPGQQPVRFTPEARELRELAWPQVLWASLTGPQGPDSRTADALRRFDVVLLLNDRPFAVDAPPFLQPISVEPTFALYAVIH